MVPPVAAGHTPVLVALLFALAAANTSLGDSGCKCEAACGQIVEELQDKVAQLESEIRILQGASAATRRTEAAPCSADWQITSDAEVEAHQGCREARNITIEGDEVTSLTGLQDLQGADNIIIRGSPKLKNLTGLEGLLHVTTRLEIQDNGRLSSLSGLWGLKSAGEILIKDNGKLTSLDGLQGLLHVMARLEIQRNGRLSSLSGLWGLKSASEILIDENVELLSLDGLQGLETADSITIAENPKLVSVSGPPGLTMVGDLAIWGNNGLTSLSSFEGLTRVVGCLSIGSNNKLEHISGFELLTSVGNEISIFQNLVLQTVTFPRLETVKVFELVGGQSRVTHVWLEHLQRLDTFESTSGDLQLVSAPHLHSAGTIDLRGYFNPRNLTVLDNLTSVEEITFGSGSVATPVSVTGFNSLVNLTKLTVNREDVDFTMAFQSLQYVKELFCIRTKLRSFPAFSSLANVDKLVLLGNTNFESFTGLASLRYVANFIIGPDGIWNDNTRSLAGLENLAHVGFFKIELAEELPSLIGLESLTTVGEFTLSHCTRLVGMTGLKSLTTVGDFTINSCTQFADVTGLESLATVGEFTIDNCTQLADITGLESLTNVGALNIQNCARLANLSGLERLQQVGAITLTRLSSLQSLDALQSLAHVGSLTIQNCEQLHSLEGLGILSTGLLHVRDSSMEYLGGPFAAGRASANVLVMDSASWPRCVTPHERKAFVLKVNMTHSPIPQAGTWPAWGANCNRPSFGTFSCTRGHPCSFSLAGDTGYTSVFISARFGGCGLCSTQRRPQADVVEESTVNFGYTLTNEEGGLYSVCRCAGGSTLGPVAQLLLRGPRKGGLTVCIRGIECSVELDGEALEPTDHVVLMSDCNGNPSSGFVADWVANNIYRLRDAWYTAPPAHYQVCWRAPCSSSVDGLACPAPEDRYLQVGEVDLRGAFTRHYTVVLGDFLEIPNIGLVSDGDWMRLSDTCGEEDEEGTDVLEAKSTKQLFDFGQLMVDGAQAGSHRLCWCPGHDDAECTLEQHFATEAGTVRILCQAGQEFVASSRRCQGCRAGTQRLEPGLEPCSECPAGQFSPGGGTPCSPCPDGKVAELTGSSDCTACRSWESADAKAGCSADPARLGLLMSFCLCVGTISALLVRAIKRWLPVLDVSLDHDCTVITTFGSHGLSSHGRSSFPVSFRGTGHPGLDRPSTPFRATVRDAARLELLTWGGKSIKQRLDTSMGSLLVASPHDLYHQGWPVPMALSLLVLSILVLTLGGLVLDQNMAAEGSLGAAATALVFVVASAGVRWRPRTTPLARCLLKFKLELNKRPPTYCKKGPNRALAVGKLHDVLWAFRDFIRDRSAYFMDTNIFRPLTKEKQVSYAELVGAEKVEWFVSHFWGTAFEHFCMALQKHAEMACGDRNWRTLPYWVCFCSNNQYKIQEELGDGWAESSFFLALKSGRCLGTCMVLDDQALPLTRIWCIFELLQTVLLSRNSEDNDFQGLLLCTSGGVLNTGNGSAEVAMALAEKVADMDLASAQASSEKDALMIREQVITDMGSFAALKDFVRGEVRSMLTCAQTNANQQFAAVLAHLDGAVEEPAFVPV